ncbi:uncharacterized protein E5676_scaffold98G00690 [Cucumis melo var. makuwa]|uniref:Uncharacterized protein n=1 Tax=Cucumis melo var. makuwa TaxID=1194695 RepID=A0A5D3C0Z2_CUCMM|nr:uncharacterized protein E6C27_scaffold262G001400 [Cucumis melo var. makuwa]TYK05613.1 uncharacterized protein E5676_scaffold98G00690 [Cucumis melo var. makuwa]
MPPQPQQQSYSSFSIFFFTINGALLRNKQHLQEWGTCEKITDPSSLTIPYSIAKMHLDRALFDLRKSINLMPLSILKKLRIGEVQQPHMRLQLANRSIAKPEGKIEEFFFPIDVESCNAIECLGWDYCEEEAYYELFSTKEFLEEDKPYYILKEVNTVSGKNKFESLDLQTKGENKTQASIEEPPKLELKPLPNHLKYAYLRENDTLPVSIPAHLDVTEEKALLNMLKRHKKECLSTLEEVLEMYEETRLDLNWEKCHFMVRERIMFGHKISYARLEVDLAKIDGTIKDALNSAPILIMPDWSQPFELMCDMSDVAVEDMLGQKKDKVVHLIYHEFDLEIIDRNGTENQVTDHLSRLHNEKWDEPFLYKLGLDQILRQCVLEYETIDILVKCHKAPYRGQFGGQKTAAKVLQGRYFWPTLFRDVRNFVVKCNRCQRMENMSNLLVKYNIIHKVATTYQPQTNGQEKVSNREIKKILEKVINSSHKDWVDNLDSA